MRIYDRNKNLEKCISTLEFLRSEFEKQAKPRMQYKNIRWALTCAIAALKHDVSKKVKSKVEGYLLQGIPCESNYIYCPFCNKCFGSDDYVEQNSKIIKTNYCPDCGQKLDWSEPSETHSENN